MDWFSQAVTRVWQSRGPIALMLWPLSLLYRAAVTCRRWLYQVEWLSVERFDVPVVVVGNISVGGTGKTPVVIAIAQYLEKQGWKPGIVSRGYGGKRQAGSYSVDPGSPVEEVGDEPVLIARRTGCPVMVDSDRPVAVRALLDAHQCNVVISDDGLQHLALHRDVEFAVVDGSAGFGNGFCLPAGPLREPVSRLRAVDMVVLNGGNGDGYRCDLEGDTAVRVGDESARVPLSDFVGKRVHAVAAVGNPGRYFDFLKGKGIESIEHPLPDHHGYVPADLSFEDGSPILMTEKDAVKCEEFADGDTWYVPVEANLETSFYNALSTRLNRP